MNYTEAVAYIHSLGRFSGTPSLDRMVSFLKRIGNPEKTLQIVHVGGTNGKGSTCAMLASIMRASGRKTGLYTSPYLDSFTNRFRIDGEDISQSEIAEMATSFRPLAEEEKLTQFEFITAIAFAFYAQKKVDILILEVGLGGRFDATNVVSPLCSVITNIGYDHMEVLGNTLEKIAFEKAGIIKPCVPVVCGVEDLGPYTVIADVARERVAPIKLLNRDFSYLKEAHSLGGQTFSYILGQTALRHLHTSMLGEHQLKNAAVALTATMTLNECGFNISEQQMHSGLAMAKWPGRFEVMSTTPLLIMDGAHNTHGMKALVQTIDELLPNKKAQMVTGIMKDKEVRAMLSYLEGRVEKMYVSAPIIPRAMPPHELGEIAQGLGFKTECYESIARALSAALEDCPNDSYVLVAGSLYAVSEARQIFNEQKANGSETGCC